MSEVKYFTITPQAPAGTLHNEFGYQYVKGSKGSNEHLLEFIEQAGQKFEHDLRVSHIREQENRILVALGDLVEFLNVMGAD